jgi:hypothetical protein
MKAILKETGDEETFVAVMASSSTRRTRRRATRRPHPTSGGTGTISTRPRLRLDRRWGETVDSSRSGKACPDSKMATLRCGRSRVSRWPNFNRL